MVRSGLFLSGLLGCARLEVGETGLRGVRGLRGLLCNICSAGSLCNVFTMRFSARSDASGAVGRRAVHARGEHRV
eukprot:4643862-Prymnesium_polylepis.2